MRTNELQRSKINDFLNGINKEIELSGQGAPEVQNQLFFYSSLNGIELVGPRSSRGPKSMIFFLESIIRWTASGVSRTKTRSPTEGPAMSVNQLAYLGVSDTQRQVAP